MSRSESPARAGTHNKQRATGSYGGYGGCAKPSGAYGTRWWKAKRRRGASPRRTRR